MLFQKEQSAQFLLLNMINPSNRSLEEKNRRGLLFSKIDLPPSRQVRHLERVNKSDFSFQKIDLPGLFYLKEKIA